MPLPPRSLVLAALLTSSGCSLFNKQAAQKDAAPIQAEDETFSAGIRQTKKGDEKLTEFDLNRDQQPDVFVYTVAAKTEDGRDFDRLVRKEMDLNWDGKVDVARQYDEEERIQFERLDLDFDGRVDQTNVYEKGTLIRKERDVGYTGRANTWVYFEKGKITRKERDTNNDGKVDYWEYWENDQVDRVGEDTNGDGTVDRWLRPPQPANG
ncbi:MAG: hypothetical protein FJ086_18540 [Deltaproteobacteria bacterium]|nr:hypothetical protein [Deltaproteobacteria bacterium]